MATLGGSASRCSKDMKDANGGAIVISTVHLRPYVNLQGQAREAMAFYHQVLGGTLDLHTVDEQGVSRPAEPGERIMHARRKADGVFLLAADGHPDYPATVGENLAIALGGRDRDRLTSIFNDLAAGGRIKMPLTEQPWGAAVGWLTDKFGINWMVSIETV